MTQNIALGIDVGGSHISCCAFNLNQNQLLTDTHSENKINNQGGIDDIINAWGQTIQQTIDKLNGKSFEGLGFAFPGPFDYENGISLMTGRNGKYENIYGINIPEKLREYFDFSDDFKIRFINDATAFAIGEQQSGIANGFKRTLAITLGTGFGSAFLNGKVPVLEGEGVPKNGCLWHLSFENGIADDYFSTRGIVGRFQELSGRQINGGVKEIAQLAKNDPTALKVFEEFGEKLARFLQPWILKFGVEVIVIGGNISNAYPLFEDSFNSSLELGEQELKIGISELKENASFVGSAALIDDSIYTRIKPTLKLM